jgi:acetolactate synthase I/II/III large subunit
MDSPRAAAKPESSAAGKSAGLQTERPVMTGADVIVRELLAHDLRTVYCLPGIQNDHLFKSAYDTGGKLRMIHTRHEQGAAYMALGSALATGRPAAYCVVPGPGFLNTTAALATAFSTNARVFCLAGQIPNKSIGRGYGLLHEIPNQLAILEQFTKWAARVASPDEAAPKMAAAFRELLSGRPRPVGLEIPPDVLAGEAKHADAVRLDLAPDPPIDEEAIERAAALLAGSQRPMIFVGGGALDASNEVRAIAERLQAPVVAYRMGRGILDDRHPLSHTLFAGYQLWPDADVVLAAGTRLNPPLMNWGVDDRLKIVRVDIDPEEVSRVRAPAVSLVGPARPILRRLAAELERVVPPRASRTEEMRVLKASVASQMAKLEPQLSFLGAIRQALPENGIFVEELTQVGYVSRLAFPVYKPRSYLSAGYQGTLGWGFAAALGAKDACPDTPVVAICGDGGFLYNVQELATAVRHRIPLVTVVFNDNAYGNVKRIQQEVYGNRVIASDLTNPDFRLLAESFGVAFSRARTPDELEAALERAFPSGEPTLIEVPCGPMPDWFPFIHLPRVRGSS